MDPKPIFLHCPLCGMEFEKADTMCAHGCPLGKSCNHVRCPHCSYEFAERPRTFAWLRKLLPRREREVAHSPGSPLPLDRLRNGESGRLVRLDCADPGRRNTLTVFGLVPGAELTLIQRKPSFVVRVGETELGLDAEIARDILLELV